MSLRTKLILGFLVLSFIVVGVFSVVAYTSARDYTREVALTRLHKDNAHFVKMLDISAPIMKQIQDIKLHHESSNNSFSLVNIKKNSIVSGDNLTFNKQLLTGLLNQTSTEKNQQGSFIIGEREYLWAIDPIPGSPFALANISHRNSEDFSIFFTQIGPPLSITLIFSIWMSLWAAAALANLFGQLEAKNIQLEHQSSHDILTQLPNRSAIGSIVQHEINSAKKSHEKILFSLIDIDGLKDINDSLGHESGDILLNQVTHRLRTTLKDSGHIGRFGGNKFAVIINLNKINNTEKIYTELLDNFEPTYEINGHNIYVRATMGIAIFPDHATGAQELIQKTETALHKAKKLSVNYTVYDISHDNNSAERLRLTHDLRNAINNEELQLHYQPQLDVRNNVINSVEALARWIHPQHGFIPPDTFIEIAEQTGLIQPLTDWVLRTAVKQCAEWHNMGKDLAVSINLSARNLHDETLSNQIANLLSYWNVAPEKLCLEITETAMMTDPEHAKKLLNELDGLGVRLSIDDFGTGYSSLGYLKQLPVDELKVDKSFVLNMAKDENDASIVRATVSLAHDLGLEVVAEGVEDQTSQNELSRLGCEYIQGYHIARPMPHEELTKILTSAEASNDERIENSNGITQPSNA